jgi:hypothetical protein
VNAVVLGSARAHDDDRGADALGPRGLDELPAVETGEHEVEHAHVGTLVAQAGKPLLPLVHPEGVEPCRGEVPGDPVRDDVVVLDDENLGHCSTEA